MNEHIRQSILPFIANELPAAEKKLVAEHLLQCESCRREHDELKFASLLAAQLPSAEAPASVWNKVNDSLDGPAPGSFGLLPESHLSWRTGFGFAAGLLAVSVLCVLVYVGLFSEGPVTARHQPADQVSPQRDAPQKDAAAETAVNSNPTSPLPGASPAAVNVNANELPLKPETNARSWQVETVAGRPLIGDGTGSGSIAVGQLLETDSSSKARISVADIGSVEIAPNSRVKLVGTSANEHRLSLERGGLHAKILAPPRLFIVDTPSAKAVDLGCEYTLEVDLAGNSILRVTAGFVALEDRGRESIVPAGMMCLTKKGKGLGTPFSADTDSEFRKSLEQFDFAKGGSLAVRSLLAKADFYDMVTLWHLLSRVGVTDRGAVFDELSKFVAPPSGVTREGVMKLDKKMLEAWRAEVENAWFS